MEVCERCGRPDGPLLEFAVRHDRLPLVDRNGVLCVGCIRALAVDTATRLGLTLGGVELAALDHYLADLVADETDFQA